MTLETLEGPSRARAAEQNPFAAPRLVRAAHEFEAQLMKELLEPMTRNDALFRGDEGEEKGILVGFASESLAGALSAGGGLGIADQIIHEFARVTTQRICGSSECAAE